VSVVYRDLDDDAQTLDPGAYILLPSAGCDGVVRATDAAWPATATRPDAVTVTFSAGYATAADVPAAIKQAMLLMVGFWYETREDATIGAAVHAIPLSADRLLAPYRRVAF